MHFLGGFWVGLIYLYIFPTQSISRGLIVKILLSVLLIGIGWEVFEMIVNDIIVKNPFDYADTTSDILFDLAGGTFASLYFFKRIMFEKVSRVQ